MRIGDGAPSSEQLRLVHKTIKAVTESMEQLKFNTAIAALIDLNGEMLRWPEIPRTSAEAFVLMLAPLAPHLAEELWWRLGHAASLAHERWPEWDDHVLADAQVEIPVQVMGRVRSHVTVAADADAPALERAALDDAKVQGSHRRQDDPPRHRRAGQAREHRDRVIETRRSAHFIVAGSQSAICGNTMMRTVVRTRAIIRMLVPV